MPEAPALTKFELSRPIGESASEREETLVPYHFEFDATNRILRAKFQGHLTNEDLKEYYSLASTLVAKMNPSSAILDLSDVTTLELTSSTVRGLAALPPTVPDQEKPRFIVAPSPPIFGFARMFELEGGQTRPNLHVVRTAKEVWAILGIREPQFQPLEK